MSRCVGVEGRWGDGGAASGERAAGGEKGEEGEGETGCKEEGTFAVLVGRGVGPARRLEGRRKGQRRVVSGSGCYWG